MLYFVIFFLWISLLIYLLTGGADFGAGILELFFYRKNTSRIAGDSHQAIGPTWEANHMWLIIALVILFVGFPNVYSTVSIYLHIPILVMLIGIIARGTSFTFRHYDTAQDRWQQIYNRIFTYSSFITPLFLGIIAGSAVSRSIDTGSADFTTTYIDSWLNWFSIATGLFTVSLCGFLAAVYLAGETSDPGRQKDYHSQAKIMAFAMLLCAGIVFAAAGSASIPLADWVFGNAVGLTAVILAAAGLVLLQLAFHRRSMAYLRPLAGFIVTMLLVAVTYAHFPDLILLKNGQGLSLLAGNAPEKTIDLLGMALLFGSLFILPSLAYLIYSFHNKNKLKL